MFGTAFQPEGRVSTNALRWGHVRNIQTTARRRVRLDTIWTIPYMELEQNDGMEWSGIE